MPRTSRIVFSAVAGAAAVAMLQAPADARPATPTSYEVTDEDFFVCDAAGVLNGRVFINSRSTGSEGGPYTATFVERTVGTLTVDGVVYRYNQASKFSEHERLDDGETSANQLIGWVRLSGSGPLAGTQFQQRINTVVDANGVTRVDTFVSSFC
jgi:hypothetical protein